MKIERIVKYNGIWYDVIDTINEDQRIFVVIDDNKNGKYILEDDCEIIKTIKVED